MLLRNRPIWQRTWVVSAGVIFNFVSAYLILFGSNLGLGVPTGHQLVGINKVVPGSIAEKAGLMSGDRIEAVAGQKFDGFDGFKTILGNKKETPVEIAVVRSGQPVTITATPDKDGRLGFQPSIRDERRPAEGLGEAIVVAGTEQMRYTAMLTGALAQLFSAPGENMSKTGGPVAIVAMGDQVYQTDPWKLLEFAVILSIELAIINLLPLPALDGGHLVLLALEKIRRRPLSREVEQKIMAFGFLLIMGLGVLLIGKDLVTVPGMYGAQPGPSAPAPSAK
jgi:RIP metalloprotease RseP